MSIRALQVVLSAAMVLGIAATGFAQPAATTEVPTYELSAGYQFLHVPDQNFPFGLAVDGARHFGQLGLVGEIGWSRASDEILDADLTTNMFHFAAGPRWTGFGSGRAWPYGQVLIGAAVARSSLDIGGDDESDTETAFMIQPGVGVTFVAGDGWGVFGQFDYRRTFFDEPEEVEDSVNNQFRLFFGFRMILD